MSETYTSTETSADSTTTLSQAQSHKQRQTAASKWREQAAPDDWKIMVKRATGYPEDQKILDDDGKPVERISDEAFKNIYGFARRSNLEEAAERGYYQMKQRQSSTHASKAKGVKGNPIFYIDMSQPEPALSKSKTGKPTQTSFEIYEDINKGIEAMTKAYWGYSKRVIVNGLLREGLEKYGFLKKATSTETDDDPEEPV